jgi:hypothetical protein
MIFWTPLLLTAIGDKELNLNDVKFFSSISPTQCSANMGDGTYVKIEISFSDLKALVLSLLPDMSVDEVGTDIYNIAQISSLKDNNDDLIVRWHDGSFTVVEAENIDSVIGFINGISGFSGSDGGDGTDGVNPFDQDLNTFNTPKFAGLGTLTLTDAPGATGNSDGSVMIAGAGNSSSWSDYDILIGKDAFHNLEEGWGNIAIGYGAGQYPTQAYGNIFLGIYAGYCSGALNNPSAYPQENIFIGSKVAERAVTPHTNIAIGYETGYYLDDAMLNVLMGSGAGYHMLGADNNIAIGYHAAYYLEGTTSVDGNSNISLGYRSMFFNKEGNRNIVLGHEAGYGIFNSSDYDDNILIGYRAGYDLSTGSKNVCLGYNSQPSNPAATNQCIIGGTGVDALKTGFGGNNNPQYAVDAVGDVNVTGEFRKNGVILETGGGGVTDHGDLTGLVDDDHTQYYNQTRGDARYSLIHSHPYAPTSHGHNDLYYTESEIDALLSGLGGGAVDSVNSQTGVVVLDAADVGAEPANANIQVHIGSLHAPTDADNTAANETSHADVLVDTDALTTVTSGNKLMTQADVAGLGGGDMLKSAYDTGATGSKVDTAINAEKVNNHTVEEDVPSGALFTDTVYDDTAVAAHLISPHAPADAQKNSDITIGEIEAKLIGEIATHTHAGGGGTADSVSVDSSSFSGNLDVNDDTVQKVANKVDTLVAGTSLNVTVYEYTSGADQVIYSGADDNANILDLSEFIPIVVIDGITIAPNEFLYNSSSVTLNVAPPAGVSVVIWVFGISQSQGAKKESFTVAASDGVSDLETGTAKVTFRMPYAFTLSEVRASVTTAPTDANLLVDINESGVSILSTVLSIDAGEKTSTTATTAAVISDTTLVDDAEITIDIDQIGSTVAGAGLKVTLIGVQA